MNQSIKYYTLWLKNAQTDEQKAMASYMLAKCHRNEWYNQNTFSKDDNLFDGYGRVNLKALDGFKGLKQYPNTLFYKEVIKESAISRAT